MWTAEKVIMDFYERGSEGYSPADAGSRWWNGSPAPCGLIYGKTGYAYSAMRLNKERQRSIRYYELPFLKEKRWK